MYKNPAEQLYDYSKIIRVYLAEYYEQIVEEMPVSDTPFEKYKGLVVSMEESKNVFDEAVFELSENGMDTIAEINEQITAETKESTANGVYLPLEHVCTAFNFGILERFILILAAMPLINSDYEKTYGYLNDNVNEVWPTLELAINLFARGTLSIVSRLKSPLMEYVFEPYNGNILKTPLKVRSYFSELLLTGEFYAGDNFLRFNKVSEKGLVCYEQQFAEIVSIMKSRERFLVCIEGEKGCGRKHLLAQCALEFNTSVMEIDFEKYRAEKDLKKAGLNIICGLLMRQCYVCVYGLPEMNAEARKDLSDLCRVIAKASRQIFICSENTSDIDLDMEFAEYLVKLPELDREKRRELWEIFGIYDKETARLAANKYKFSPKNIKAAALYAKERALISGGTLNEELLNESVRSLTDKTLCGKAELIESQFTLDDLIIPEEEKEQIREACGHIKYRDTVYDKWNFESKLSYGKGLSVLFAGPPGTGKTMAATIMARELGLNAYRVDISKVMSKYIGETEKSLGEIFDAAQQNNSVLFFDETDALFGKRSEIKDSHDKYANVETSFLLQRLETFDGVVLMSTNLINNIDEAFMRRINYVVRFPFPNADQRLKLWKSMFPEEMPIDEGIDFEYLAERFEFSGGIIKNTVMSAAFLAAEDYSPIGMTHLLRAVRKQLAKQGRVMLKEDFGRYSMFI